MKLYNWATILTILVLSAAMFGCANSGPIPIGKDTYTVSARVPFGGRAGAKSDALMTANEHCGSQKKNMMLSEINSNECALRGGCGEAQITYSCLDKDDPRNRGNSKETEKIEPSRKSKSFGSGFFISNLGHVVTNQHVVKGCKRVTVGDSANKQIATSVIETDEKNDLALLRISSTKMSSAETKSFNSKRDINIAPLSTNELLRSEDVELGEEILVAGYPYGDIFSNTVKVTKGIVSAIRGMGNDSGQFQIDAAVQPGSSGGPIYDQNGNIVGVVVSQLSKLEVAKAIGSLPENINFGIKASTVRQFLTSAGLPSTSSKRSQSMATRDLAKIAKNQTMMVLCHR